MPRKRIIIHGDVQGVGFRFFALREAQRSGVVGWVRNRMDGSVEIEAQADEGALESFIESVGRGPSYSEVSSVDISVVEEIKSEREFRIRM